MPASFMNRGMLRTATLAVMVVAAAACSDQQITGNEIAPAPITADPSVVGMLRGTIRGDGTIYFESLDPSIQVGDNVSGAIYGNQNVTAKVTTSQFSVDTSNGRKRWKFKLAVHNLLNYPVGSVDAAATPYDTVGMYVFFLNPPTVTAPANCGCTVSIDNTQGTGNFNAPGQKYYWYHDRLAAKGQTGDSTQDNPTWAFSAPLSANVTNFRFFVILSSPWPRGIAGGDTTWSVLYSPAVDSFPDINAKPRWKTLHINQDGSRSLSNGTLNLTADQNKPVFQDKFFYRSDSLVDTENAFIEARLALTNSSTGSNPAPAVILGLADNLKFVGVGIAHNRGGLVKYDPVSHLWEWIGAQVTLSSTGNSHTYRVGKFGDTQAVLYVDGQTKGTWTTLPANFSSSLASSSNPQLTHLSSFFGITAQDNDAAATINYVTYAFHATPQP